MQFKLTSSW